MRHIYPLRLTSSLHETIWGGRRLEKVGWKTLPAGGVAIGESWETEISTLVENGSLAGQTLGQMVALWNEDLLGKDALAIFGPRFPLLAKFIDARTRLSVQVHPDDRYASLHEQGKLGKTEFWYILGTEPGASIVHGFERPTSREEVQQAIDGVRLEGLMHEEPVNVGDVILVPAGTVHAIGSGVLLYELQEYSDVTYRLYDYGRRDAQGRLRELHVERSLDVSRYEPSRQIKMRVATLADTRDHTDRCLVASRYFVTREIRLRAPLNGQTSGSCVILTLLSAQLRVLYGPALECSERLARGQTLILPAALGQYRLEGNATFLWSYVPASDDQAARAWYAQNA